jgi:hypothetical protein
MQNKQHRPMGVTIIAILTIISGILFLLSGIALVALGSFSVNPVDTTISTNTSSSRAGSLFIGIIFAGVGGVFLAIGIGYLVMFYGLLKGKGWAWSITIILIIIGIAIQIVSTSVGSVLKGFVGSIIGIAIDIVILYYLYRPHVKAYFGKVQPPTTV